MVRALAWGLWMLFVGVFTLDAAHELGHALSDHHAHSEEEACDVCAWDWAVVSEWEPATEVPFWVVAWTKAWRPAPCNDQIAAQCLAGRAHGRAPPVG